MCRSYILKQYGSLYLAAKKISFEMQNLKTMLLEIMNFSGLEIT